MPVRLSETPCLPETPEPILGEHTQEVLRSVGISDEAMEEMLPGISKIIVSPEAESVLILGGTQGITPIPVGPSP